MKPLFILVFLAAPVPAFAQSEPPLPEHRCFYASMVFSPGAEVAFGELRYSCVVESDIGTWRASTNAELKPSCVYEGKLYAGGASEGTGETKVACQADGTWKAL
jgi:hypothetical protein